MKKVLWLDDYRDPLAQMPEGDQWILVFSPIFQPFETHWVKSYQEFVDWITQNGLPDGICFDHDLSDVQAFKTGYPEMMEGIELSSEEKTGMDCAKWLVEYCMDYKLPLPLYNIQSANPVGKENIRGLLQNFLKKGQ